MVEKFIFVDLTERCNLRCKTCYNVDQIKDLKYANYFNYFDYSNDLDFETLKNIISFFAIKGFNRLQLLGGEPLLYRWLEDVVIYAKALGFGVSMVTNGLQLSQKKNLNILKMLDLIYVSFDGTSANEHDYIRGDGSYNKILTALKNYREVDNVTPIAALFVLNARRAGQPIFEWIEEINLDGLSLQVIEPAGMALKYPELFGSEYKLWELLANEFNTKPPNDLPYLIKVPPLFKYYLNWEKGTNLEIDKQNCFGFIKQIYVDVHGRIYPCRLSTKLNKPGFTENNLNSYPKSQLSEEFFKSKKELILPKICRKCKFKKICQPCHLQCKFKKSSRQVAACKWALKQLKLNLIKEDYHV